MNRFIKHFVLLIAMLLASVQSGLAATSYDYKEEIDGVTAYFTFNTNDRTLTLVELSDKNIESFNVPAKASNGFKITGVSLEKYRSLKSISIPNSVTTLRLDYCTSLKSIKIPNSVTTLRLSDCTSLTSVEIPNSVTTLCLSYCTSLTSVEIPNSVTTLRLSYCTSLTSVEIPNSVTSIGEGDFIGCTSLVSVVVPNSVTSIGRVAFKGCTSLTSVEIPNSVTSIGESAFYNCTSLESVVIPNSVMDIVDNTFYGCTGLESLEISDGVKTIGMYAFWGCKSLTSVVIPKSVYKIRPYAFKDCTSLQTLIILSDGEIGKSAFLECDLTNVIVNSSNIYVDAFDNNKNLSSIIFLNSLNVRASFTCPNQPQPQFLSGCNTIKKIVFYHSLTLINERGDYEYPTMNHSIDKLNLTIFVTKGYKSIYQKMKSISNSITSSKPDYYLVFPSYYIEEFDPDEDPLYQGDGIETIVSNDYDGVIDVYNMSGVKVLSTYNKDEIDNLPKGIYVVRAGQKSEKYIVK